MIINDAGIKFSVSRHEGLIIRDALDMLIDVTPDYLEAWDIAEMVDQIETVLRINEGVEVFDEA